MRGKKWITLIIYGIVIYIAMELLLYFIGDFYTTIMVIMVGMTIVLVIANMDALLRYYPNDRLRRLYYAFTITADAAFLTVVWLAYGIFEPRATFIAQLMMIGVFCSFGVLVFSIRDLLRAMRMKRAREVAEKEAGA